MQATETASPPSRALLFMEGRAILELGAFFASLPVLRRLPRGDGHPVLVFPGLAASDLSTRPMRGLLRNRGYRTHGWELGRNLGLRPGVFDDMVQRLDALADYHGEKISLIGWSLGGIYARELAKIRPGSVRQVISLGSPFAGHPKASHAWRLYEFTSGHSVDDPPIETTLSEPPPVPTTSIFSKTDGVVHWQTCQQPKGKKVENIRVEGSHMGLGHNPMVLYVIADRLAQAEGEWRPFSYPKPIGGR